ncbi:MAG: divalent-cation tolerance protein CutA [Magnetococcales bacterium]|nr:divalent-cation tolerance protein CutA [Magnetococcales bacterium]MBF0322533.1 divalent-cation tolerance protein CutA [Magnetococcales bacterium]
MTAVIVWCTVPDVPQARVLATTLVKEGLAACVHLFPVGESIYTWEGKVEKSAESLLMIKSRQQLYLRLQERLRELHPYHVPEILAVPVSAGLPEYLSWLTLATGGEDAG